MDHTFMLNPPTVSAYSEWMMLRALFEFGGLSRFCGHRHGWISDEIASALGLPSEVEQADEMPKMVKALLGERYRLLKQSARSDSERVLLEQNIAALAERLQLNRAEMLILRLAVYMQIDPTLKEALNLIGRQIDRRRFCHLLAEMLNQPFAEIRAALHDKQKLMRFGLLQANRHGRDFDDYLCWGDTLDADKLDIQPFSEETLLKRVVQPSMPAGLAWSDFEHTAAMACRIRDYLHHAYQTQRKGVNILLYGAPGTGKTEFASLLAHQLALSCYTLGSADEDEDMIGGQRRLQNVQLAQTLLAGQRALLVFDEVEDVFASSLFQLSAAQSHKAWVNQFLEHNAVPMVWISNDVGCMDEAFLRRFDIVLHMPDLPQQKKAALVEQLAPRRLSEGEVAYLAKQQKLTPAMLTRSFQVASALASADGDFGDHVFSLLNQTMKAQGKQRLYRPSEQQAAYSLDWVACDHDLHKISRGLQQNPYGRICCYGPPGTGKTAWANWLGQQAGLPVLLKQGSDLLGKYVGETEKNIAAAFEQAGEQNMLLVLDEVDSFLFAREGSERSWERSMVNEMLTQIERFEGLLVVSTNLMHNLDSAALRRFDLKLAFSYLTTGQALALAAQHLALLQLPELSCTQQSRLKQMGQLTPGDFAAVARRHRFAPFENGDEWLSALENECALKPQAAGGKVGFL